MQNLSSSRLPAFMQYERLNAGMGVVLSQFRRQEPVHAYLLTGARGLGKLTLAKVLASALFCTSESKPCGHCEACRRVFDNNEPDVLSVLSEDGSQIGVDRVREIIQKVSQHAFGTGYRVVIIEPVEKMTLQAQNCLLKSLEEPVANVVFLLLTHELTATLGTIASRCIRAKLTPWPDECLHDTLIQLGYEAPKVASILPRCGGNIGMALEMLDESKLDSDAQSFAMDALAIANDAAAVSLSTRLKEGRDVADAYLASLEQAVYQALLVRTGQLDIQLLHAYPPLWQKAAQQASIADFNALLTAVFDTRRRRAGQVNWQSNIDHLMMRLLEEHNKWQQSLA